MKRLTAVRRWWRRRAPADTGPLPTRPVVIGGDPVEIHPWDTWDQVLQRIEYRESCA
ncbi:hypothetical protein [Nocardia transvalensis]|uniref:hypothetical protein n=1 Tax=Nocardia transvalensis TaxID=37333 RepID=UPI0018934D5B|nr:hypothetical protein [Nocardia transvalensis]MBF6332452.1 hypothetical protein [Nocardia transvalensis]